MQPGTPLLPVLQKDGLAYYDGIEGIIPCKINSIVSDQPENMRPGSWQDVKATVTEDCGAFKKGYELSGWAIHFFPRKALGLAKYSQYIKPYRVQA